MEYVYQRTEPELWTAGFYGPDGKWQPESDHGGREEAAARVHWLNGGCSGACVPPVAQAATVADEECDCAGICGDCSWCAHFTDPHDIVHSKWQENEDQHSDQLDALAL